MSKRYWTADMHLGHSNIIKYCERPFQDCHHMNKRLIDNANQRIQVDDTCVHVGDFCVRGGQKARDWIPRLTGRWSYLRGNHDPNNGVKTIGTHLITRLGKYHVFASHVPYYYVDWFPLELRTYVNKYCDFAICGHVHDNWLWSSDFLSFVPCLNVGVDVHKYMPIPDDEIINMYLKQIKEKEKE